MNKDELYKYFAKVNTAELPDLSIAVAIDKGLITTTEQIDERLNG